MDANISLAPEQYTIYKQAQAKVDQAKFDLANTIIYAPINGVISNLSIKSESSLTVTEPIFGIIDDNDIWIEANFKETQLNTIRPKQTAIIKIDSFPNQPLRAIVTSITKAIGSKFSILPAQNASGNWVKVI